MMIMPSNNKSGIVHYWSGKYPGQIGLLISPLKGGWVKGRPPYYMPYALDNGCFVEWKEREFYSMLKQSTLYHKPLWVVVPDVVGDREKTLEQWARHKDRVAAYGLKLAFACQDGMTPGDVPKGVECCFIGGSTDWKLENAHKFKGVAPLLHVARVNTLKRLLWAFDIGVDSVDGTGWFRGGKNKKEYLALIEWFEGKKQLKLF